MNSHHHSSQQQLIALRIEPADLDALIDRGVLQATPEELALRGLKKCCLALRDAIDRLARGLVSPEPA